uniref:ditrans,polycis-polyprenyl diphosphate synthase [(2E,6E)-farnesyldiphosphate specific] n=1 Tax=Amphimedon queenslandica TaxID=400682 RepID=A0A1X7TT41_AMPQE
MLLHYLAAEVEAEGSGLMSNCNDLIDNHGVCIRVLGDIKLLPTDVQESVARAVTMTKNNNKVYLNECFSYASRYEITDTIQSLVDGSHDDTTLRPLLFAIINWEKRAKSQKLVAREYMYIERKDKQYKSDRDCALVQYYEERGGGGGGGEGQLSKAVLEELISHYAAERKKRTQLFVQSLIKKRNNYLETVTEQ